MVLPLNWRLALPELEFILNDAGVRLLIHGMSMTRAFSTSSIAGRTCTSLAECAVIGVPDETWGEVGRAFVVTEAGTTLSDKDVMDHCYANLARYKVPRSVRFVAELPHNARSKLVKHLLPRD